MLLSSHSDIKTLKQAIALGCSDFVTKPFSDELLIEKVHKLINREFKNIGLPKELTTNKEPKEAMNQKFSWRDDYKIGIEEIDREHKAIIDNYEKLYQYMTSGKGHEYYSEIVDFLKLYVNEHFAHEEVFQASIHYDQLEEHKEYHRLFKEKIKGIIKNYKGDEVTDMDLVKFNLFLKDWLLHHILIEDAKIGQFLEKQKK